MYKDVDHTLPPLVLSSGVDEQMIKEAHIYIALVQTLAAAVEESDIENAKINNANFSRLNLANSLAMRLFTDIQSMVFEKPPTDKSFIRTVLVCKDMIPLATGDVALMMQMFVKAIANISVSKLENGDSHVSFEVHNIWE